MTRFARLLHRHYWLSALLLGCVVLRAFVPAGYMLDTAGGDVALKMCSGMTLTVPAADPGSPDSTAPGDEGPTGGHHGVCPAGMPLLALAHALTLSAEAPTIASRLPAVREPARSSIPPSPTRLPRGPPTFLV